MRMKKRHDQSWKRFQSRLSPRWSRWRNLIEVYYTVTGRGSERVPPELAPPVWMGGVRKTQTGKSQSQSLCYARSVGGIIYITKPFWLEWVCFHSCIYTCNPTLYYRPNQDSPSSPNRAIIKPWIYIIFLFFFSYLAHLFFLSAIPILFDMSLNDFRETRKNQIQFIALIISTWNSTCCRFISIWKEEARPRESAKARKLAPSSADIV